MDTLYAPIGVEIVDSVGGRCRQENRASKFFEQKGPNLIFPYFCAIIIL